jgi:hypothetical protein
MTTDLATSRQGYDEAVRTARDYQCADCGGVLLVRWRGDRFAANCGRYPDDHEHIRSHADVQADDTRERLERNPQVARALAVQGSSVPLTTQAIKDLDNEKLMARVPDRYGSTIEVSKPMKIQLAQLARIYGLDPLWDLMLYEGRPYVTYDGRLRKMREHPEYRGHKVRPLSRAEKEEWGYDPADLVIQCDVDMGPRGVITDWGIVRASEVKGALERAERGRDGRPTKPAPVASHPQQIGIKRAVYRASKQAVGIDLPTIIESGGRVIDVQEVQPRQHPLPAGDAEAQARRRFWSIARGSPPDGLGLDEADVHRLLQVETLKDYPGGWDQALSDLTERAAEDMEEGDDVVRAVEERPAQRSETLPAEADDDQGEDRGGPERAPEQGDGMEATAADDGPEYDTLVADALKKNVLLLEDARSLDVKGLGALTAKQNWPLHKVNEANTELAARIRSRNNEIDTANAEQQKAAF